MRHIIVGTAGHVDHGKTQLIKALTGTDTDRLREEKKRGITIELGFASLPLGEDIQAGIVDVPGHEKFIKNMLAGAGGIDLAMLIVAADEGFMPQTVEHLNILQLLGVQAGVIVLTKMDLVDDDWLELMHEEVRERVRGTFLQDAPIVCVSAFENKGLDTLRQTLHEIALRVREKSVRVAFRLPTDRVFSIDGFGTVVTGTLMEGCLCEGDEVMLYPALETARVRTLQVHSKGTPQAFAGQRVAVNLSGIKKQDISRGDVLAKPESMHLSKILDVKLTNLPDSKRTITNQMRVHVYHGSSTALAKVVLLDRKALNAGEQCYAQLRLNETLASKNGDRFVLRFYSPLETIGGGVILDNTATGHKAGDRAVLQALKIKESGSSGERVLQVLEEFGTALPAAKKLAAKLGEEESELIHQLQQQLLVGTVLEPLPARFIHGAVLDSTLHTAQGLLAQYHEKNPLHAGMPAAELRQKLFGALERGAADAVLQVLVDEGKLRRLAQRYANSEFQVQLTKRQAVIREQLLQYYKKANIEPMGVDEVLDTFPAKEQKEVRRVLESVTSEGLLVMVSPQLCYHSDSFEQIKQILKNHFQQEQSITLAQLRDALHTSRKFALAILEYFDKIGVTKKIEDSRILIGRI